MTVKRGQIWRDDTGYLYKIVAVQEGKIYARHPNAKPMHTTEIHPCWFESPGWQMTSEAA